MSRNVIRSALRWLLCAGCAVGGGAACGSGSSEYGDAPLASGGQLRWEFVTQVPAAGTLLVLVDDTPAGAGLRDALAKALNTRDSELLSHRASCGAAVDPAAVQPIDRSIVFVHPSTPDATGYSSPAQDPSLGLDPQSDADHTRWMVAVRDGINAHPAAPGAAFQALAALAGAESLLDGSRAPSSTAERAILDALPSPLRFAKVIALATEDASPGEASEYPRNVRSELLGAVLPAAEPRAASDCSVRGVPTSPRYQAFSDSAQAWPCENPDFLGTEVWSDCSARCLPQPIAIDAGIAQCRAMASYPGSEPCPSELGWLDPLDAHEQRTPRVDGSGSNAKRVCEIRQLEGPALAACKSRLDCTDCQPGWCATEIPELIPLGRCLPGSVYPPFRFVLGAGQARDAQVTVVCNEAPR